MLATLNQLNPFRLILRNPVVLKELRGRMRGARAFVVLTIYLSLVIFFMALAYSTQILDRSTIEGTLDGGEIGRLLFSVVIYVELFLVMFITPTVTTNAISGEHESQTYDLLRTTLLPEKSLVAGKLFSALAYILLLLLATIPLQGIALVFGGVSIEEIVVMQSILMVTACFFGAVGVYFSASTRRTLRANMLTYAVIMGFIIAPFIALIIIAPLQIGSNNTSMLSLLVMGFAATVNPIIAMVITQDAMQDQQTLFLFDTTLNNGTTISLPMPWLTFTLFYLFMAVILFWITTRRLKRIDET